MDTLDSKMFQCIRGGADVNVLDSEGNTPVCDPPPLPTHTHTQIHHYPLFCVVVRLIVPEHNQFQYGLYIIKSQNTSYPKENNIFHANVWLSGSHVLFLAAQCRRS